MALARVLPHLVCDFSRRLGVGPSSDSTATPRPARDVAKPSEGAFRLWGSSSPPKPPPPRIACPTRSNLRWHGAAPRYHRQQQSLAREPHRVPLREIYVSLCREYTYEVACPRRPGKCLLTSFSWSESFPWTMAAFGILWH